MSRRKRTADDWRKVVFRSHGVISWRTRLYLVYLSDWMNGERKVSRPRHLVATDLGITERTVDRMTSEAIDAEFLSTVIRGRKGVTAVYQGIFPKFQRDNSCRPEMPLSATTTGGLKSTQVVALKRRSARQQDVAPIGTTEPPCETCNGWGCDLCSA